MGDQKSGNKGAEGQTRWSMMKVAARREMNVAAIMGASPEYGSKSVPSEGIGQGGSSSGSWA